MATARYADVKLREGWVRNQRAAGGLSMAESALLLHPFPCLRLLDSSNHEPESGLAD